MRSTFTEHRALRACVWLRFLAANKLHLFHADPLGFISYAIHLDIVYKLNFICFVHNNLSCCKMCIIFWIEMDYFVGRRRCRLIKLCREIDIILVYLQSVYQIASTIGGIELNSKLVFSMVNWVRIDILDALSFISPLMLYNLKETKPKSHIQFHIPNIAFFLSGKHVHIFQLYISASMNWSMCNRSLRLKLFK